LFPGDVGTGGREQAIILDQPDKVCEAMKLLSIISVLVAIEVTKPYACIFRDVAGKKVQGTVFVGNTSELLHRVHIRAIRRRGVGEI
jgi:hypothetical protein